MDERGSARILCSNCAQCSRSSMVVETGTCCDCGYSNVAHMSNFRSDNEVSLRAPLLVNCDNEDEENGYNEPRHRVDTEVDRDSESIITPWRRLPVMMQVAQRFRAGMVSESEIADSDDDLSQPRGGGTRPIGGVEHVDQSPSRAATGMTQSMRPSLSIARDEPVPSSPALSLTVPWIWVFLIANLLLELLSEVFNQISSKRQPHLGLIGMLFSLANLVVCITELIYRGCKEKVAWKKRDNIYWFFRPDGLPFGTLFDVIALTCSISQLVFSSIAYAFFRRHADDPIKLSAWPIIFAFGLLCSKILERSNTAVTEPSEVDIEAQRQSISYRGA